MTGILDASEKSVETIHGHMKKVLLFAMIIEKEHTKPDEEGKKQRCRFLLDDGTARVSATWFENDWMVGKFEDVIDGFHEGDLVILTGRPSEFRNAITIIIDNMRVITDIKQEFHHKLSILQKLKALKVAGKPLKLENGGTILNMRDPSSSMFSGKELSSDDLEGMEEKLDFGDLGTVDFEFKGDDGTGAKDDENWTELKSGDSASKAQDVPEGIDEQFVKEMILQTLFELDCDEGVEIDVLKENVGYDAPVLRKFLTQMEHEGMVEKVSDNPETFRPK
ncbi:MAG: OB-fold nucleic acid binding domain-containing protein [Promethearchaeota archaeon]